MRRAGKLRQDELRGFVSRSADAPRHAGAIALVRRRRLPIGGGIAACRCEHECFGDRHYPSGSRFANKDGRRKENAGSRSVAAASADYRRRPAPLKNANGCKGTARLPDSAAHPARMHPCRDAGNRAMSVRIEGYRAAQRANGGRKGLMASNWHGISVACVAFRAARGRPAATRITPDNCRYQEQSCQSPFAREDRASDHRTGRHAPRGRQPVQLKRFSRPRQPGPGAAGRGAGSTRPPIIARDNIFADARETGLSAPGFPLPAPHRHGAPACRTPMSLYRHIQ